MSGGLLLSSAAGILFRCRSFVSTAVIWIVTVGWRAWKSSATFCQYVLRGPSVFALCHQVRVTGCAYKSLFDCGGLPLEPLEQALTARVVVVTSAKTAPRRRFIVMGSPKVVADIARAWAECYSTETRCQSLSITVA